MGAHLGKRMKNRRKLIVAIGATALASPLASFAQKKPSKADRVAIMFLGSAAATAHFDEAFTQALKQLGHVEGKNVIMERRYADGKLDRLPGLAAEVVRTKADVIVTSNDAAVAALLRETQTIPIVMTVSLDPVATGFVASLPRPGGNITGLSYMSSELSGKRVELLKEVVPGLARVAYLWNPEVRGAMHEYQATQAVARLLGVEFQAVEVTSIEELDRAFAAITSQRSQGLVVQVLSPLMFYNRAQVVSHANRNRLPTVYGENEFAETGGLMSYGANAAHQWRRAATFVDRILKGRKPADLPVELPVKLELVINMKTANALGITIPRWIMLQADRVIG